MRNPFDHRFECAQYCRCPPGLTRIGVQAFRCVPWASGVEPMQDPQELRVGDRVRFIALPEEWSRPGYTVHRSSISFMKMLIRRQFPSRVYQIDKYGTPWIAARIRRKGRIEYHTWGILEATGWRLVRRRN